MLRLLTTSVNYSDYLNYTLKYNIEIFDEIYIATTKEDSSTHQVIKEHNTKYNNIRTISTDLFYSNKAILNKGAAINLLLQSISKTGWVLIGDADCIYPLVLKTSVPDLDPNYLFGMYRHIVDTAKDLENEVGRMSNLQDNTEFFRDLKSQHGFIHRLVLGYCQLFNFSSKFLQDKELTYPDGRSCRYVDTIFSRSNFNRKYKSLLDMYCIHLGQTATNWYGRKSDTFI